MKKVILHIGLPKTGSSAIQNFLNFNSEFLNKHGFFYHPIPLESKFAIQSGNGLQLYNVIKKANLEELESLLDRLIKPDYLSIISCEQLGGLTIDEWNAFLNTCNKLSIEIDSVIYFVRDFLDFLISDYDQKIKRHGLADEFSNWADVEKWTHYQACKKMLKIFSPNKLQVIHYNSEKSRLVSSFFEIIIKHSIINISDRKKITEEEKIKINRSLTNTERDCLIKINAIFGDKYSTQLSDLLIGQNPQFNSEPLNITRNFVSFLENKSKDHIDWVNFTFFESQPVVSFSENIDFYLNSNHCANDNQLTQTNSVIFDFLINELNLCEHNNEIKIWSKACSRLIEILKKDRLSSLNETAFSTLHYALLNPDVLRAGVDPEMHYLKCGKNENRKYQL